MAFLSTRREGGFACVKKKMASQQGVLTSPFFSPEGRRKGKTFEKDKWGTVRGGKGRRGDLQEENLSS